MRDYLKDNLDDVSVKADVPSTIPAKLITVTGAIAGPAPHQRYLAWRRVVLRGRSTSGEIAAGNLIEEAREVLLAGAQKGDLASVHKVVIVGEPGKLTDPDDGKPIIQMTVDLLIRATQNN